MSSCRFNSKDNVPNVCRPGLIHIKQLHETLQAIALFGIHALYMRSIMPPPRQTSAL